VVRRLGVCGFGDLWGGGTFVAGAVCDADGAGAALVGPAGSEGG
jgi:hypothetical protein